MCLFSLCCLFIFLSFHCRYGLEEEKPRGAKQQPKGSKAQMSPLAQIVMTNFSKNREDFNAKKEKTLARVRSYFEDRFVFCTSPPVCWEGRGVGRVVLCIVSSGACETCF